MIFARYRHLRMRPENQSAECVFIVHHVVERKSRVRTRRWQYLEEGPMRLTVRIAVARTPRVSTTQPWLEGGQNVRLETGLRVDGSGALFLYTPAAGLNCAPEHHIDRSSARLDGVQSMAAKCIDENIRRVSAAHSGRAIICFENVAPIIVFNREYAGVGRMPAFAPITRIRGIAKTGFVPSPAIHLEHTACWDRPDNRDVVR